MIDKAELDQMFISSGGPAWRTLPTESQRIRLMMIRRAARQFSEMLVKATRQGPDQSRAIMRLRECVSAAGAALASE